jgi:hypothetical protein
MKIIVQSKMIRSSLMFALGISFLVCGLVVGYDIRTDVDMSLLGSDVSARAPKIQQQVLGVDTYSKPYVNPFSQLNEHKVQYPINQLRGCRNWKECYEYCSKPPHFKQCIAWKKTNR